MRWVKDGPDIPVEIVRAVQDGHLVFFCGAGVSQQAGLPGFKGLVNAVYEKLRRQRALFPLEQKAFDDQDYDQVFTSLEASIKNPKLVRDRVAEALQLPADADTRTHEALLRLATDSQGMCRLVTTNYDLCFLRHMDSSTRVDAAPRLPVPRPGRWNSIVHLHGFLQDCGPNKQDLVLSSADFGAAYLVDGWATRFLRELFQHFTVLFIGYRADDLVVRYMLQALAVGLADKGEEPRAFAFAEVEGDEGTTTVSWEAKGIKPILYAKKHDSHAVLHETLRVWADKASLGLLGRKSVVAECLGQPAPVERDEVTDQVLWALKDENGATAKFLADQEPSPSPRYWLATLDQNQLLSLGNVPLVDDGDSAWRSEALHPVTWNLAQWLCRHLAQAEVLDWALGKGGCLNPRFRWLVRDTLRKQTMMPAGMRAAWSFLARPVTASSGRRGDLNELKKQIASGAWDLCLQHDIAAILEPSFVLKRDAFRDILRTTGQVESDSYPLEIEITFAGADEFAFLFGSIHTRPDRDSILSSLLDDCTTYLRRILEVQHYFGKVSPDQDWTCIWLESINPSANRHHRKPWIALINVTAACLEAASRTNPLLARSQVDHWKTIDYPLFRRLVCHALTLPNLFTVKESLAYILDDDSAMWHYGCSAEAGQLLAHLWPSLNLEQSRILIQRLLAGPPGGFYTADLPVEDLEIFSAEAVEKRLSALLKSGRPLPPDAEEFLSTLKLKYGRVGVDSPGEEKSLAGLTTGEIARLAAGEVGAGPSFRKHWASTVSDDWQQALAVLRDLSSAGKWPMDIWKVVLDQGIVWTMSTPPHTADVISILELVTVVPKDLIAEIINSLAQLLEFVPRLADFPGIETYWLIWDRALSIALAESAVETRQVETLEDAINTASGRLTEALFEWVRQRSVAGKHEVPEHFWDRLQTACDVSSARARAPRIIAARRLSWLFSKNREWVRATLLPSFDWSHPEEATAVWQGFLFQPNFYLDLWTALRKDFLLAFENAGKLPSEPLRCLYQQFARIVIHCPEWLTSDESQRIVTKAHHEGRQQILWVFWGNLQASGDKANALWRDRIGPWLAACWQPDEALKDPETSRDLIRMVLAVGDAFPEAVDSIEYGLTALNRAESAMFDISRSQVPEHFPQATLKLLDLVINRSQRFYKGDLVLALTRISQNWPEAGQDRRFLALSDFADT
jgi:hypothetical protein